MHRPASTDFDVILSSNSRCQHPQPQCLSPAGRTQEQQQQRFQQSQNTLPATGSHRRMQSRQYPKHYIKHLEQQLHELRAQAQVLAEQQQSLRVQHSIVSACCEVLHSMRTGAVHRRWRCLRKKRAAAGFLPQELPLLLDLGFQLDLSQLPELQQVVAEHQQQRQQQQSCARYTRSRAAAGQTGLPRASIQQRLADDDSNGLPWQNQQQQQQPGSRGKSARAEAAAPRQQLFLVPGECLGPLRYALSQPPCPGATKLTLAAIVQHYTSLVKDMSFSLHLIDQQQSQGPEGVDTHAEQMQRLKERLLEHARYLCSVMLLHPDDLMSQLRVVNCETLELSDTPEQALKRMSWLAEQLDLTAEQCHALTAGGSLFKRLLETVRAERQQHVARQQATAGERLPSGRALDLQGQQDMADRLAVLVRKELLLLSMTTAFVGSVLDVRQMAVMTVLAWPWVPHLGMLAAVLATQHAEKEQQQKQQEQLQQAEAASAAQLQEQQDQQDQQPQQQESSPAEQQEQEQEQEQQEPPHQKQQPTGKQRRQLRASRRAQAVR